MGTRGVSVVSFHLERLSLWVSPHRVLRGPTACRCVLWGVPGRGPHQPLPVPSSPLVPVLHQVLRGQALGALAGLPQLSPGHSGHGPDRARGSGPSPGLPHTSSRAEPLPSPSGSADPTDSRPHLVLPTPHPPWREEPAGLEGISSPVLEGAGRIRKDSCSVLATCTSGAHASRDLSGPESRGIL